VTTLWIALLAAIGGSLIGYVVGAFCATAGNEDLRLRNAQLYWTVRGLIEAGEPLHDDVRLGEMLKTARDILKENSR
jgi:hypothetical protein